MAAIVLYNLQNDFVGWQFQFHERNPWQFSSDGLWHLPIQAIVVTPILYVALLWSLWRAFHAWWQGDKRMGLMFVSAGMPIILFATLAFFVDQIRVSLHWPLQALLVLIIMLPFFMSRSNLRWHGKLNALIVISGLAGVLVTASYFFMASMPTVPDFFVGKKYYPDNFVGWNEVSSVSKKMIGKDEILVADNFMLAAQLRFSYAGKREVYALDHPLNQKHGRARQLQNWNIDGKALMTLQKDSPVLLIIEETATKEWLRDQWRAKLCNQFHSLKFEKVVYGPGKGKSFSIFRAKLGADPALACDPRIL